MQPTTDQEDLMIEEEEEDRNERRDGLDVDGLDAEQRNDDDERFQDFLAQKIQVKRSREELSRKDKISIWVIGFSTFFLSVATILGTGILGLPVKLYITGFWPFFSTFVVCFIMQAMIIVYLTDILQTTEMVMRSEHENTSQGPAFIEQESMIDSTEEQQSTELEEQGNTENMEEEVKETTKAQKPEKKSHLFEPDLHSRFYIASC